MSTPSWQARSGGFDERPSQRRPANEPAVEEEALASHLLDRLERAERQTRAAHDAMRVAEARRELLSAATDGLAEFPVVPLVDLTRLAVPLLGEWCVLDVATPGATEKHVVAREPGLEQRLRDSLQAPEWDTLTLVVPVKIRGRRVGTLTFGREPDRADYDQGERAVAREFGALIGVALEQRRMAAAAQSAARAKTDFLTMMSHELRTPLNAIAGYAQLLEMGFRGQLNDAQRDAVTRILRAQEHLLELVDSVLTFSRLTSGRLELDTDAMRSSDLMDAATQPVVAAFAERGIDFRVLPCSDNPMVHVDRERGPEALGHLLSNALKFTPTGGRVSVSCETEGALVRFIVTDTGRGIPVSQHETIFRPFVQVEKGLTRSVDGSGLGLAVARELATRMGGTVTVTSEVGAGSRFVLTLDRYVAPAEEPSIDSPSARE